LEEASLVGVKAMVAEVEVTGAEARVMVAAAKVRVAEVMVAEVRVRVTEVEVRMAQVNMMELRVRLAGEEHPVRWRNPRKQRQQRPTRCPCYLTAEVRPSPLAALNGLWAAG
jgi:hypothetical protein